MVMRIGLPARLITTAYQIGTDDLLVIINPQNHVNELTADQVRAIFTGRIQTWEAINGTDALIQVWVYSEGEDVQQVFEKSVLGGSPVTSLARLANSPEEMSQAVSNNPSAVGIITRRLKTGTTSDIFTAASSLPVLVFTRSEPQGPLAQILACLQK
jgi:phosphate transport system substrate-binding protein